MRTQQDQALQATWRQWLQHVISTVNPPQLRKPTPFAQAAGLAPSTITRALDEDNPGHLSLRTIQTIVSYYGVAPPQGFGIGAPDYSAAAPEILAIDAEHGPRRLNDPNLSHWRINTRALELAGLIPGDVVTVDERLVHPEQDQIVCVRLYDFENEAAEIVLRRFDAPYLMTLTADPDARATPERIDDRSVKILGTVVRAERDYRAA